MMPTAHQAARSITLLAVCAAALAAPARTVLAQPVIAERFDTGLNGWSFYNDASDLAWENAGGNPDGCARAVDLNQNILWGFSAPAAFLGDKSAYFGGTIAWDVKTTHSNSAYSNWSDVTLISTALTLVYNVPGRPAVNIWTPQIAPLTPAAWRITDLDGAVPTEAEFRAALAAVTGLRFNCEWSTSIDTGRLDNVVLTPPPPPTPPCGAADLGRQGGLPGADGELDNNDFVVFIDAFFALRPEADFGRQGGIAPGDGMYDNNDFVVFIDRFFAGCP